MRHAVAILIPCHNEAATVGEVVASFRQALPEAKICVCDNASSDDTAAVAAAAGAEVWVERLKGKGNALRRLFAEVEADVYVMVDGDATYDAAQAPGLVRQLNDEGLDMVVARRVASEETAYRSGHVFGNRLLTGVLGWTFGRQVSDVLSGYRALSWRFVKSFPALATGFEIETELTVHALQLRLPINEVDSDYRARPEGSHSKLRSWPDGMRILSTIGRLAVLERPFTVFGWLSVLLALVASGLFVPVFLEYLDTGLVPRLPSLVVAIGGYTMALLSLVMGTLLNTTATARWEAKRFRYLDLASRPRR